MAARRCHFCDQPFKAKGCCKPCYAKQRRVYSVRTLPKFHTLMPDDVREIRYLYDTGNYSQSELGQKFGVSGKSVCQIVHRKTWANVD